MGSPSPSPSSLRLALPSPSLPEGDAANGHLRGEPAPAAAPRSGGAVSVVRDLPLLRARQRGPCPREAVSFLGSGDASGESRRQRRRATGSIHRRTCEANHRTKTPPPSSPPTHSSLEATPFVWLRGRAEPSTLPLATPVAAGHMGEETREGERKRGDESGGH